MLCFSSTAECLLKIIDSPTENPKDAIWGCFLCDFSLGPSVSVLLHDCKEQLFACEKTDAGDLSRETHHSAFTQLIFNDLPFNVVHLS